MKYLRKLKKKLMSLKRAYKVFLDGESFELSIES